MPIYANDALDRVEHSEEGINNIRICSWGSLGTWIKNVKVDFF